MTVSTCGNFGIVGAKSGWIDVYNMQSGIHRGTFVGKLGHKGEITGLIVTQLNNILISSSLDGTIKVSPFLFLVLGVKGVIVFQW